MSDVIKEVVREMLQHANSNGGALGEPAYAHTLRDWADRLAALAGAAPVAWLYECPHDGESDHYLSCGRFLPSWVEAKGATETPLFTHAPAKAREDDARRLDFIAPGFRVLAGDHRLQVWWVTKDAEGRNVSHVTSVPVGMPDGIRSCIDAALATFAEGAE